MNQCVKYIQSVLGDRPDLAAAVTPEYPYFGKRPIKDSNFYPTLLRDDVELVPRAVERVTDTGIVDSAGDERAIDIIVMATGFHANEYLSQLEVRGIGGTELHDHWNGEPTAFLGMTVPGFPNFFMMYGPNTNSPVTLFLLESQAKAIVRILRWAARVHASAIDVKQSYHDHYDAWMLRQMEGSVWSTSNNYYKTDSGRVVTQWPVNPVYYWIGARFLAKRSMRILRKTPRIDCAQAEHAASPPLPGARVRLVPNQTGGDRDV